MSAVMQDNPVDDGGTDDEPMGGLLSDEERDLLVKRLAACGLPTREIARITGTSGRTVARIMQRGGITRKIGDGFNPVKKGYARSLPEILRQYYGLEEVTLDSLSRLAGENSLPLKSLLDLVRENVSPSCWAIRPCLGPCGQSVLTSSPADRYCLKCKIKVKKDRKGIREDEIYG